jgi:hypothetical protein
MCSTEATERHRERAAAVPITRIECAISDAEEANKSTVQALPSYVLIPCNH